MLNQTSMVVETPKPLSVHLLWLSSKAPFASGHKAVITKANSETSILARSMKLNNTYSVQIFNRKKVLIDTFTVTYSHSKYINENVLVKHEGLLATDISFV